MKSTIKHTAGTPEMAEVQPGDSFVSPWLNSAGMGRNSLRAMRGRSTEMPTGMFKGIRSRMFVKWQLLKAGKLTQQAAAVMQADPETAQWFALFDKEAAFCSKSAAKT